MSLVSRIARGQLRTPGWSSPALHPVASRGLVFAFMGREGIGAPHDLISGAAGLLTNTPVWRSTPAGWAIDFPAAGTAFLDFAVPDDSRFTGPITLVWRGLIRTGSAYRHFAGKHISGGTSACPFDFRTDNSATPNLALVRSGTGLQSYTGGPAITLNKIQHYAVSVNGGTTGATATFYVDGKPTAIAGSGTTQITGSNANIRIGRRADNTVQMDGFCQCLYIFNRALNVDEIKILVSDPFLTWPRRYERHTWALAADIPRDGIATGILDDLTGEATGTVLVQGPLAGTLDDAAGLITGYPGTGVQMAGTLADATGTATGRLTTHGIIAVTLDDVTGTAVGEFNTLADQTAGFWAAAPDPVVVGAGNSILTPGAGAFYGSAPAPMVVGTPVIPVVPPTVPSGPPITPITPLPPGVVVGPIDYTEAGFDHAWLVEIDWFGNGYQRYASRELKYQDQFYAGRVLLGEQEIAITRKLSALSFGTVEVTDIRFALNNSDGDLDQLSSGEHRGDRIRVTLIDCTSGYVSVELYGMVAKVERDVGRVWVDCRDIDLSMFEKMIPGDSAIIEAKNWPLAVDIGSMIPLPFGIVPKCPLRYVVKDTVNGVFTYIAGFGELDIHHIYRIRSDGLLELIDPMLWPLVSAALELTQTTSEHLGGAEPYASGTNVPVPEGSVVFAVTGDFPAPYNVSASITWGGYVIAAVKTDTGFTFFFENAAPANATVSYVVTPTIDLSGTWLLHVREPNFACAGPSRAIVVVVVADGPATAVTYGSQSFTLLHEVSGPDIVLIGPIGSWPGLTASATGAGVLQIWYLLNPPKGIAVLDAAFDTSTLQGGAFPLPWVVGMVVTQVSQDPADWAWETASGTSAVWDAPGPTMPITAERHETVIAVMAAPNGADVIMTDTAPRGMYETPYRLTEVEVAGGRLGYYQRVNALPPPYTLTSILWQEGKSTDVSWRLLVPYGEVLMGGSSPWVILGLRVKGIPAYTSVATDEHGPCVVTMVTMVVEQLDQNGSDMKLCADVIEAETGRNHALAIRQVLSNSCWGAGPQDIDEAAFDAVADKLTALELFCDGALVDRPVRLQDVLEQLMLVRGIRLRRTALGWAVFMDEPQSAAKANVITGDTVAPGDRVIQDYGLRTQSDIKDRYSRVILNYRFDFLKLASTEYLFYITREVFGDPGQEKIYDVWFVRDHRTADKMLAYISRRAYIEDESIDVTFDAYLRFIYEGDLVLLTIPALRYFSAIMKIAERALDDEKERTTLVAYDLSEYDYVESIPFPPANPTLGDLDDYSQIRPDPAESLELVTAESIVNPDTTETVTVVLKFVIAETDNFAKAIVRYRTSWSDELIGTETAFQWTDGPSVDHTGISIVTLRGLAALGHYDFTVSVTNAYKLASIGDPQLLDQIMPGRTPVTPTLAARVV